MGLAALLLGAVACGQAGDRPAPAGMAEAAAVEGDMLDLGEAAEAEACVGVEVKAETLAVDLFAVLDVSGSMKEATFTGVSKWYATKAAFQGFLDQAPVGMGFGLSLFPVPGDATPSCDTEHYRDQALPIRDVKQMASSALTRLDELIPQGQTPTGPALSAALELATAHALKHVDRSVIVVLATDGLPTTCAPTDTAALARIAKAALEGPAHVRTLVVASSSLDNSDLSGFQRIAAAGGTTRALVIDPRADFAAQLTDSLSATAAHKVACDLALPEPPRGERLDYDAINVALDGTAGRVTLPRVPGPASCTAAGGWYYDVDPTIGAPTRLDMCKSSCEGADASTRSLRVELGCKTFVR